jgi:phage tail protein X
MAIITDVRVRQPAANDLIGRGFVVSGIGAGFEGTIGMRLLGPRGQVLATGSAQCAAGGVGVGEFSTALHVQAPPRPGTKVVLQVFGDNPGLPDEGPSPGFNTREVPLIMFPDLAGWLLYRVESGDTLTEIARKARPFVRTSVAQIVAANPKITDPDVILAGWRLRIPLR